jgi:hypothetical protein
VETKLTYSGINTASTESLIPNIEREECVIEKPEYEI